MGDILLELLKMALGKCDMQACWLSEQEWHEVYEAAWKQSVSGVCFAGINKLPEDQRPPEGLYFEWLGDVVRIQQQNMLMDLRTAEVWRKLKKDGLGAVVLKGQGIAHEYGEIASLRQAGDIDIWVKGGYQTVCDYVQRTIPTDDVSYLNFGYSFFKDTDVELHFRPTYSQNMIANKRLSQWYDSIGIDSFIYLDDKGFSVPPISFNVIFILSHIYKHFLGMGIGLRQVMDYYFVLKNCHTDNTDKIGLLSPAEKAEIAETLKDLRLMRFAEAMMWILHNRFGLEEQYLICGMNEKEGQFVLSEIMQTGNFGRGDLRYNYKYLFKLRRQIAHGAHLLMHYPSEVMWAPIWLVYHKIWKWNRKRCIRRSWK